jgi:hypothetical protein
MFSVFSSSLSAATIRSVKWLFVFTLISVVLVDLLPARLVLALLAGPNVSTLLEKIPLVTAVTDWFDSSYKALPGWAQSIGGVTLGAVYHVLSATASPSALLTWTSMSALTGAICGVVACARRAVLKPKKDTGKYVTYLTYTLLDTILIAGALLLLTSLAFRLLPVHSRVLTSGLAPQLYTACILFGCVFACVYTTFASSKVEVERELELELELELVYLETQVVASVIAAVSCMLVIRYVP